MFKVDLKTKTVEVSKDKLPTPEELMPKPGFKVKIKKQPSVKTF